jgi:hypothetical protein
MKTFLILLVFFGGLILVFGLGYLLGKIFKLNNYIKYKCK